MEVKGFPNYLIYPDGRVLSRPRMGTKGGLVKPFHTGKGYLCVNLHFKEKRKTKPVHRLVGEHYIPNPENKRELDHINRNSFDNRIENLRWVTPKENTKNTGCFKTNQVGFKYIGRDRNKDKFRLRLTTHKINKTCQSLSQALCYSFFYQLKYPQV